MSTSPLRQMMQWVAISGSLLSYSDAVAVCVGPQTHITNQPASTIIGASGTGLNHDDGGAMSGSHITGTETENKRSLCFLPMDFITFVLDMPLVRNGLWP